MLMPHWTKVVPVAPVYSSMSVATSLSMVVRSSVLVVAELMWYQIALLAGLPQCPESVATTVCSWTPLMYGTVAVGIGVISVAVAWSMLVASGRLPVAVTRTSLCRPTAVMSSPLSIGASVTAAS